MGFPKPSFRESRAEIAAADARKLAEKIKKKGGKELLSIGENLVDKVWGDKRPPRPNEKVAVLAEKYTGKPLTEKLEDLRKELEKKKSAGFIVCEYSRENTK